MKKIPQLRGMQDTDPLETAKNNFVEKNFNENDKISRISLIRKYFSKLLRNLIR